MQDVSASRLVNLLGISLDGDCYGSFKRAHFSSLYIEPADTVDSMTMGTHRLQIVILSDSYTLSFVTRLARLGSSRRLAYAGVGISVRAATALGPQRLLKTR